MSPPPAHGRRPKGSAGLGELGWSTAWQAWPARDAGGLAGHGLQNRTERVGEREEERERNWEEREGFEERERECGRVRERLGERGKFKEEGEKAVERTVRRWGKMLEERKRKERRRKIKKNIILILLSWPEI